MCGGSVYQWKRIKVGIYALSKAAKREKLDLAGIFDYEFKDWCYIGPTDFKLESNLKTLEVLHYIQIQRKREKGDLTQHSLYILEEQGFEKAKAVLSRLSSRQLESLEKVAKDLKDEESHDAIALYSKYAQEWGREEGAEFKKIAKIILATASQKERHELVEVAGDKSFLKDFGIDF
jgi:hypothetical protein